MERITVKIWDNEHEVIKSVISALTRDPEIFQKDGRLVWWRSGRLCQISSIMLRMKISSNCILMKNGKAIHMPSWLPNGVRIFGKYPNIKEFNSDCVIKIIIPELSEERLYKNSLFGRKIDINNKKVLIQKWPELYGANEGISASDAVEIIESSPKFYEEIRDALISLTRTKAGRLERPRAVEKCLVNVLGCVLNGKAMKFYFYEFEKRWIVVPTEESDSAEMVI